MVRLFVTGIGTGVGKTVVSAICCKAFGAAYWKPIETGSTDFSEGIRVHELTGGSVAIVPGAYSLRAPLSPHIAARREGISIDLASLGVPSVEGPLVIEGAGGVLVPINESLCMVDLINAYSASAIVVAREYLGCINHTLLTIEALVQRDVPIVGVIVNGGMACETIATIEQRTGCRVVLEIAHENEFDADVVSRYAERLRHELTPH